MTSLAYFLAICDVIKRHSMCDLMLNTLMHTPIHSPNAHRHALAKYKTALDTELTAVQLNKRPRSTDTDKKSLNQNTKSKRIATRASIERRDDGITLRGRL